MQSNSLIKSTEISVHAEFKPQSAELILWITGHV